MIGDVGPMELLIIGVVVILLFGVGKIGTLGRELGTSVKEFRRAVQDDDGKPVTATGLTQSATVVATAPLLEAPQQVAEQPPAATAVGAGPNIF